MAEQGTQTAQAPVAAMSEAGFSMNVKMLDGSGQEVMLTFRCPMFNQAEKLIDGYNALIGKLLGAGWQPIGARASKAQAENSQGVTDDVPTCRVHGSRMKPSKKAGSFYCPRKEGDAWCKEKVG